MSTVLFPSVKSKTELQEEIRSLLGELGMSHARHIAEVAIERGLFDDDVLNGFALQGAMEFVRNALKAKQDDGLSFARPVGPDDEWKQRTLWTYKDAFKFLRKSAIGIAADQAEFHKEHEWCLGRFGKAPDLAELLAPEPIEA